jgi:hypothetical protein
MLMFIVFIAFIAGEGSTVYGLLDVKLSCTTFHFATEAKLTRT